MDGNKGMDGKTDQRAEQGEGEGQRPAYLRLHRLAPSRTRWKGKTHRTNRLDHCECSVTRSFQMLVPFMHRSEVGPDGLTAKVDRR
jgi:hypothetical protein